MKHSYSTYDSVPNLGDIERSSQVFLRLPYNDKSELAMEIKSFVEGLSEKEDILIYEHSKAFGGGGDGPLPAALILDAIQFFENNKILIGFILGSIGRGFLQELGKELFNKIKRSRVGRAQPSLEEPFEVMVTGESPYSIIKYVFHSYLPFEEAELAFSKIEDHLFRPEVNILLSNAVTGSGIHIFVWDRKSEEWQQG